MKKKIAICGVISTVIFVGMIWINQVFLWPFTGIRFSCNSEYTSIMRWTDGGYDSWGFEYSHGHQFDGETWKNLWHFPTWRRASFKQEAK